MLSAAGAGEWVVLKVGESIFNHTVSEYTSNTSVCQAMSADCENAQKTEDLLLPEDEAEGRDEVEANMRQSCWKRIPGFGLILVIVKNILGGASDVVVKKIENIGFKNILKVN